MHCSKVAIDDTLLDEKDGVDRFRSYYKSANKNEKRKYISIFISSIISLLKINMTLPQD